MPHKHVYGKRSRAIYDPFQAFASPQRPTPQNNIKDQGAFVAEVVEELSRLKVQDGQAQPCSRANRRVLGEKSANELVNPVEAIVNGKKSKRTRRKVEESGQIERAETRQPAERKTSRQKHDRERLQHDPSESMPHTQDFVADEVPMFVDGHGYETEDEQTDGKTSKTIPNHSISHPKRISQDSEAPSISILPPTPPTEEDEYSIHCAPLLNHSPHGITSFTEWTNQLTNHFTIMKIAEASFGEVYRLSLLEDLSSFSHSDESVLKIIALKPPESSLPPATKKKERAALLKKSEAMSRVADVANEVRLLQRMSTIPGFTNFRDVRVMQGRPSQPFIKAFKEFNVEQKSRKKEASVFPDPAKKASYLDDQLWAVIEMQDAGDDLERQIEQARCQSIWSVWDVFWQVVLTLAKGEEGAEFEHRDLHLGNVCVRHSAAQSSAKDEQEIDTKRKLNFTDLETTIIDYTLSRALLPLPAKDVAFHDLSTPQAASIFEGDSTEEYQYEIYRYMRGCVVAGDPYHVPPIPESSSTTRADFSPWQRYTPRTNLLWMHFLLHSLLEQLLWPSATKAPPRKKNGGKDHARWKRGNDLEHVLLRIQEILDPGEICGSEGLASTGALVGLALEEGWLDVGDVVGSQDSDDTEGEADLTERVAGLEINKVVGEGDTLATVERKDEAREAAAKPGRTRRKRN